MNKKLLILALMLALGGRANAVQLGHGLGDYFPGNVGIGTTTPSATLEVVGVVKATSFEGSGGALTGITVTDGTKVLKAGDTMTGTLELPASGLHVNTSALVVKASYVGIGTSEPAQSLDIVSTTNNNFDGFILRPLNLSQSISIGWNGLQHNTSTLLMGTLGTNPIKFFTGGSANTRVTILSGGNVGIGSAEPGSLLTVAGTIETTLGGVKFPDATIQTTAVSGSNYVLKAGDTMTGTMSIDAGTNNPALRVRTDSNTREALYIAKSGNIGIGTAEPSGMLHVNKMTANSTPILLLTGIGNVGGSPNDASNGVGIGLVYNASGNRQFWIGDSAGGAGVRIIGTTITGWNYLTSTDANLSLGANGMNVLFPSTGKVGIGAASPGQKLTVAGTIETTVGGIKFPDATIQTTAALANASDYVLKAGGTMTGTLTNTAGANLATSSGNVGIGTTEPGSKLTVAGTIEMTLGHLKATDGTAAAPGYSFANDTNTGFYRSGSDAVVFSSGGDGGIVFGWRVLQVNTVRPVNTGPLALKGMDANGASAVGVILDNTTLLETAGAKLVSVRNNATEKAYITKDGGAYFAATVESASGGFKFPDATIQTTAATPGNYVLKAGDTMTGTMSIDAGTSDPALRVRTDSNTREALYIAKSGNVGIGTTGPGNKLTVSLGDGGVGTPINILGGTGATSRADIRFDTNWTYLESTTNRLGLLDYTGGGVYINGGKVGIGATTPGQKLTVAGTIETTLGGIKFPDATIQTTAALANASDYVLKAGDTMTGTLTTSANAAIQSADTITLEGTSASANILSLRRSGTQKAYFDNNGNLNLFGLPSPYTGSWINFYYDTGSLHTSYKSEDASGGFVISSSSNNSNNNLTIGGSSKTKTSATQTWLKIDAKYNQTSGTAANTDLLISRTETALGSGAQKFISMDISGAEKAYIDRLGQAYFASNVSIGTTETLASLDVAGGIVSTGTTGNTPVSGAGTRLMWIPAKYAFRAGRVTGTKWDAASIGNYSAAFGLDTTASGLVSTALGNGTTASGDYSTALGGTTTASGNYSVAMGSGTTASGVYSTALGSSTSATAEASTALGSGTSATGANSTAMGGSTTASGGNSTAMGSVTVASGTNSTAMGRAITVSGNYSVGIGLDTTARTMTQANALAIMGGNVGIGTAEPHSVFHDYGSFATKVTVVGSSPYTALATDHIILVNVGGISTVNLPTAAGIAGRQYIVKNLLAGTPSVVANGAETIDGSASYNLGTQNKYVVMISDGANWQIVGNN